MIAALITTYATGFCLCLWHLRRVDRGPVVLIPQILFSLVWPYVVYLEVRGEL